MTTFRSAVADDAPCSRDVLAIAVDWRPGSGSRSGDEVMSDPFVSPYLVGWPRPGDVGIVAEEHGEPIGAAWCRCVVGRAGEPSGYGFVGPDVPEPTVGVIAPRRRRGIGRRLIELVADAVRRTGVERISLSVEADNPAVHLYRSLGSVEVDRVDDSPTMVLDLARR